MTPPTTNRRFITSRYADRYSTPNGALPPNPSLEDVFQEDLDAIRYVGEYIDRGEKVIRECSWFMRMFRHRRCAQIFEQERYEAEKLARLVFSEGQPLIAALVRVAHSIHQPVLAARRSRLIDISVAATRNDPGSLQQLSPRVRYK